MRDGQYTSLIFYNKKLIKVLNDFFVLKPLFQINQCISVITVVFKTTNFKT